MRLASLDHAMNRSLPLLPRPIASDTWVAVLLLLLFGAMQLCFADITFHGPDQIRDMAIARKLLHEGQWPLNSPPLFDAKFYLPPGFYYLLTLPLLVVDSEASVFIAFGALYVLSVYFAWRRLAKAQGHRAGLLFVAFSLPVFATLYTHSAWNPALVMTLSNVLLGLFLTSVQERKEAWFALPLAFFLLVQVHPSAGPLALGLGAYVLANRNVAMNKATIVSVLLIMGLLAWWAGSTQFPHSAASTGSPGDTPNQGLPLWIQNVANGHKWADALLMPYRVVVGISPHAALPVLVAAAQTLLMLAGILWALVMGLSLKQRAVRWMLVVLTLWFMASMAFLQHGAFWHLDVIQPWIAAVAACGWSILSERLRLSDRTVRTVVLMIGIGALAGQWALYRLFEAQGKIDLSVSASSFPRMRDMPHQIPSYSYRYLHQLRDGLNTQNACQEQIQGLPWILARDLTSRAFDVSCQSDSAAEMAPQYFVTAPSDHEHGFRFTQGLTPRLSMEGANLYMLPALPIFINGEARRQQFSNDKVNYMTYMPTRHEHGLHIQLHPQQQAIVRIALRCTDDTQLTPESWTITGTRTGTGTQTITQMEHYRYLGNSYYDFEWALDPQSSSAPIRLSIANQQLYCDLSVVARAVTE